MNQIDQIKLDLNRTLYVKGHPSHLLKPFDKLKLAKGDGIARFNVENIAIYQYQ